MATGGRTTVEELLVNLQSRQEAKAEVNHKVFIALHEIVNKLGSTVVDLSNKSVNSTHAKASSSSWNREGGQHKGDNTQRFYG